MATRLGREEETWGEQRAALPKHLLGRADWMLSRAIVACLVCWSTFLTSNDLHGAYPDRRHKSSSMSVSAEINEALQDLRWVKDEGCSRMSSRLVRSFLVKDVYPRLPFDAALLPDSCQLNPKLDRYRWQEGNKTEVTRGDHKCMICGKHFRTEFYLDKHMHSVHTSALQGGDGAVCLGDLCPIFGCSHQDDAVDQLQYRAGRAVTGASQWQRREGERGDKTFRLDEACTPTILERQQYQCDALMRKCFNGIEDPALQKQFKRNICGELECIDGILKGSIVQRGLDAFKLGTEYMRGDSLEKSAYWSDGEDDDSSAPVKHKASFLFHILRMLLAAGIVCFVIGYSYFAGVQWKWPNFIAGSGLSEVLSKFSGKAATSRKPEGLGSASQPARIGRFHKPAPAPGKTNQRGSAAPRSGSPQAPPSRSRFYANAAKDHNI